jgi:8-oxo-dGTP diphosphatase
LFWEDLNLEERGMQSAIEFVDSDGKKAMSRRHPGSPMVGVGALIFRKDTVLLVQRGREPSLGKWTLPGGLVELGESLEEAVKREVMEEVGLQVVVGDLAVVLDRVFEDSKGRVEYHYVLLDFFCEAGLEEPHPASDVTACLFVPLEHLSDYSLTEGTEEVIRRAVMQVQQDSFPIYDPHL